MRLAPGPAELEDRQWRATAQRGLAGHKTVVFVNLKGGATKTTATFMVGATLGRVRGGNLLDWDNNENQGTLGDLALPASHDLTARDLLDNIERFEIAANSPELMNYMRPQGENRFHVLASQNKASNTEVIDGSAFVQLQGMLRQFYHLILVDTGNAATASTWQAAVEIADEIVLVALNKEDSTKKLAATVDTLVAQGLEAKLARGVLLLTEPTAPARKGTPRDLAAAKNRADAVDHFSNYVREIVHVPYDNALADGARVVFENLQPATRRAYLTATAAIVAGL
jgi:MinD-like ATPase involved in chromosome partitioning or flagellar assembly